MCGRVGVCVLRLAPYNNYDPKIFVCLSTVGTPKSGAYQLYRAWYTYVGMSSLVPRPSLSLSFEVTIWRQERKN